MVRRIIKNLFVRRFDSEMPCVQINWRQTPDSMYSSSVPSFSWVGKSKNGVRPQITEFATCRETFIDYLRGHVTSNKMPIPKNRVAFLFARCISYSASKVAKEKFQKRFFENTRRGVRLLNILESHVGWSRTRMFATKPEPLKRNAAAYFITGSAKWMRSPQLLSLYCLILRCGQFEAFDNANTVKGIFIVMKRILEKKLGGNSGYDDRMWMKRTWKSWLPLLKHSDTLYKGRTLRRNYDRRYLSDEDSGFHEGIYRLASGKTMDIELRKRWADLTQSLEKKG